MGARERWEALKAEARPYAGLAGWVVVALVVMVAVIVAWERLVVALWCFALTPALAQPTAPELILTVNEPDTGTTTGRFEFAKLPELALVRGIPQIVQLGFYQIDPTNRWPPGDVERTQGWLSKRPTQLVDATSGAPVNTTIVRYEDRTGELKYLGTWSGDMTVALETVDRTVRSTPFRIRVLTPTVVYGANAVSINQQKGWNARLCPSETTSFAECRQKFAGGASDAAPLVVFITPGSYGGQDWYLSTRRFIYVLGDPNTRPTLSRDSLAGGRKQMFYVANLTLNNVSIAHSGPLVGAPNTMIIRSVYQCCEDRDENGIVNPNTAAMTHLWSIYWHASESKGMGGVGNTTHPAYIEGRPKSLFDVNNIRVLGSRGSSGIKTTVGEFNVRHSLVQVAESLDEIANGVCIHPGTSTGCLMHTPVDFPGYSNATIYANRFLVWRGPTQAGKGRSGVLSGTIFVRQRGPTYGSDIPNYPNKSWNPPESSQATKVPPCYQWDGTAATYVQDKFWQDVRKLPLADPQNPCTFKHYISYNQFVQLPGSLGVYAVRDDGTYAAKATSQFSTTVNIYRTSAFWAERSTNLLFGNTFEGFNEGRSLWQLDREPNVRYIEPLSYWPRNGPDQYPRVVETPGEELPPWFKL